MKKLILSIFLLTFLSNVNSQILQMRVLNVENKDIPEFEAAVAKKTQMFNGKGAKEKFFTFKILTGPNAQNYARIRVVNNLGEFDYQNTKGNNFWFKSVPHTSGRVTLWNINKDASYRTGDYEGTDHRRIAILSYKEDKKDDFWTFQMRIKKAYEKIGHPYNRSVLNLISGGSRQNVVMIRWIFKNFEDEEKWRKNSIPKIKSAYNELFGAWDVDYKKYGESLVDEWGFIRHHTFMPSLSSPRD